MYHFKSTARNYKTYRSKWFTFPLSSNGSDPDTVVVKVYNTKKPKAEIQVYVGSFSESRGVGYSDGKTISTTDAETVLLCRRALTDDTAVVVLIDKLNERNDAAAYMTDRVLRLLNRWWVLAQQESVSAFIDAERRAFAFDRKPFAVGDAVSYHSRHGGMSADGLTITAEKFDWHPYFGGGWNYTATDGGYRTFNGTALNFTKTEQLVTA